MSRVSEVACYSNYTPIMPGDVVYIIKAEFTEFSPKKYAQLYGNAHMYGTYSIDDTQFQKGILISTTKIADDPDGKTALMEYVVEINNEKITFRNSPRIYYFKSLSANVY